AAPLLSPYRAVKSRGARALLTPLLGVMLRFTGGWVTTVQVPSASKPSANPALSRTNRYRFLAPPNPRFGVKLQLTVSTVPERETVVWAQLRLPLPAGSLIVAAAPGAMPPSQAVLALLRR